MKQHTFMTGRPPVIGLMLGDMTGIGPEISAKLLAAGKYRSDARVVVIGDARVLELGCRDAGVELEWQTVPAVAAIDWPQDRVPLGDLGNIDPARIGRGEVSPESGRLAGETLEHMIGLALGGSLDGICFAPLNKAALHRGGWKYPDEHQMFAALTRHSGFFGEMNVIDEFSTFRVTSHVALREAVDLITPERIASAIELADATLRGADPLRHYFPEGAQGRIRRRRDDVSRPGPDRDQAARLQQGRDGDRGTEDRLHHAGSRHRLRYRRQGPRRRRGDRARAADRNAARRGARALDSLGSRYNARHNNIAT